MSETKEIILNVLHKGEKIYPRYKDIAKKIENDQGLDSTDFIDIMTIVAATIKILTENLEKAEMTLNEQEKLLYEYIGLVERYSMMTTAPSSPYPQ